MIAGVARQPHQVAVAALEDAGHAAALGERAVLGQMQRLAMHRDEDLRAHPGDQRLQLLAARMAGHMHQVGTVGDHLDALLDQPVETRPTAFSLPGIMRAE